MDNCGSHLQIGQSWLIPTDISMLPKDKEKLWNCFVSLPERNSTISQMAVRNSNNHLSTLYGNPLVMLRECASLLLATFLVTLSEHSLLTINFELLMTNALARPDSASD